MTDLFSQQLYQPLAARMRPDSLDGFYGQQHLIGPGKPLREAIESQTLHSMVFWGPPGVGKTTLAKIIAASADAHFESISAVLSGVKEIRELLLPKLRSSVICMAAKLFYLSMRCIALTSHSRMHFCLLLKMAR
jgi:putative ATPase